MYPREVSLGKPQSTGAGKVIYFFLHIIKKFIRVFSKPVVLVVYPVRADWPQFEIPKVGLPGCLAAGDFMGQEVHPAGREAQPALPSMAEGAEAPRAGLWLLQAPHMQFLRSPSRSLAAGEEAVHN